MYDIWVSLNSIHFEVMFFFNNIIQYRFYSCDNFDIFSYVEIYINFLFHVYIDTNFIILNCKSQLSYFVVSGLIHFIYLFHMQYIFIPGNVSFQIHSVLHFASFENNSIQLHKIGCGKYHLANFQMKCHATLIWHVMNPLHLREKKRRKVSRPRLTHFHKHESTKLALDSYHQALAEFR